MAQRGETKQALFVWAIGAALFANAVAFFGISYFDQTIVVWYALLAMISTVTTLSLKRINRPDSHLEAADISTQSVSWAQCEVAEPADSLAHSLESLDRLPGTASA
jgi:hypothetical protein